MTAVASLRPPPSLAGASASKDTGRDIWSQIIAEKLTPSAAATAATAAPPSTREASLLFLGPHQSGKSSLIQGYMYRDRDETPRPTSALEYRYTRTSVKDSMSDEKSLSHFWELGGGSTLTELMDVAVRDDASVRELLAVVVVDCSRPGLLLDDTLRYIDIARKKGDQAMQQMKANASSVSRQPRHTLPQCSDAGRSAEPLVAHLRCSFALRCWCCRSQRRSWPLRRSGSARAIQTCQ